MYLVEFVIYIHKYLGGHGSRLPPLRLGFGSQHGLKWESWLLLAIDRQLTVQNPDKLYVLVSSVSDMTSIVLKAT